LVPTPQAFTTTSDHRVDVLPNVQTDEEIDFRRVPFEKYNNFENNNRSTGVVGLGRGGSSSGRQRNIVQIKYGMNASIHLLMKMAVVIAGSGSVL